jgi:arylsulfatase A-like enzyme
LQGHTTLPEFFKAQGYDIVRCGKMFHSRKARTCKEKPGLALNDDAYWTRIIKENDKLSPPGGKVTPPTYLYDVPPDQRERDYDTRVWV